MTSPKATTEGNRTAGSNSTNYPQNKTIDAPIGGKGTKEGNMTKIELRDKYFSEKYDYLTGVRIASTLGGFFALVLLTLLYKSKCKKNSCASTPVLPVNITGNIGQTIASGLLHGDVEDDQMSMSLILIDSPYMNQVLENSFMSPAVLLTEANSESSGDEENLSLGGSRAEIRGFDKGGNHNPHKPQLPPISQKRDFPSNAHLNPACSSNYLNPTKFSPPLTSSGKKRWLQQNIDIHVTLPTPTISPSGSENFCTRVHKESESGRPDGSIPIPVPMVRPRASVSDRSRANSFGADSNSNYSYSCSYNGNDKGTNPLFFLDNLKYVDDTSSENIPTRASDFEDQDQDTRSIGSDSVFAYFEHNFDHVAPLCSSEGVSISGLTVASGSNGNKRRVSIMSGSGTEDDDCECRVILTQAQAQVHHRESFCSELESLNDYLENRRRSSSTQTTMSDLRQCLSISSATSPPNVQQSPSPNFLSSGGGKSPPKPFPSPPNLAVISNPHFTANVLTVTYKDKDREIDFPSSSSTNLSSPNNATLLAVNRHPPPLPTKAKKKKFPALKKTYSLQCDEPLTLFSTVSNSPISPHPNSSQQNANNVTLQLSPPPLTPNSPLTSDNEKDSN